MEVRGEGWLEADSKAASLIFIQYNICLLCLLMTSIKMQKEIVACGSSKMPESKLCFQNLVITQHLIILIFMIRAIHSHTSVELYSHLWSYTTIQFLSLFFCPNLMSHKMFTFLKRKRKFCLTIQLKIHKDLRVSWICYYVIIVHWICCYVQYHKLAILYP